MFPEDYNSQRTDKLVCTVARRCAVFLFVGTTVAIAIIVFRRRKLKESKVPQLDYEIPRTRESDRSYVRHPEFH